MPNEPLGLSIDEVVRRTVAETAPALGYASRRKGERLAAWQRRLRRKLCDLLAIAGKPRPAPPVRFVEEKPCDGYVQRRGYAVAEDGLAVPLYVLEPDPKPEGKLPVCIAAHGHGPGKVVPAGVATTDEARRLIESGERDYGVQAVRRGYLALVPDLRGFGELVLAEDVSTGRAGCWQLANRMAQLGRPLLGQRVSDVMQLIDWALARPDVDPKRVVMTGNSGGGTMTLFTAAVDRRIAAAAPSCYFSTFAGSTLAMWHCPCNFVPGLSQVAEMADLGGLMCPRPMLVIAGATDTIFPIGEVRKGYAALRRTYADAGEEGRLDLYEGGEGHRFYAARVWDFFDEQLGNRA